MIQIADIGDELSAAGLLAGLLTPGPTSGTVDVNLDWFSDPISNLEGCGSRLNAIVALLDAVLGPPIAGAPLIFPDARWYSIPNPSLGTETSFKLVATDKADPSGQIGLGIFYPVALGQITGQAYVYVPLFAYSPMGATLTLASDANPCLIGFNITGTQPFVIHEAGGDVSFTAVDFAANLYLDPAAYGKAANLFTLTFTGLTGTTKPSAYTSLAALLHPDVELWLLQAVVQSGAWLSLYVCPSFTLGDLLEAAGILSRKYAFVDANFPQPAAFCQLLTAASPDPVSAWVMTQLPAPVKAVLTNAGSTPAQQAAALTAGLNAIIQAPASLYDATRFAQIVLSPETDTWLAQSPRGSQLVRLNRLLLDDAFKGYTQSNPYSLNLASLQGTPAEIALNIVFNVLDLLASLDTTLIDLPGGGISIAARNNADGSEDFGLCMALNLPVAGGDGSASPAVNLCLGTWLTAETDSANWMTRSGGSAPAYDPGVSVYLLHRAADHSVSFQPSFALVSIGIDLAGAAGKPLVDVGGYTFNGTGLRVFLYPGDPLGSPSQWDFGAALRFDSFGFPLAPTNGSGDGGNAVAQNFLSSGTGSAGDTSPINPAFSAALAWRSDSTNSPKIDLQLFDDQGDPTDIAWIPVQRAFGPVNCQRIGVGADLSIPLLSVLFDGGVALGALDVELTNLSIGVPLRTPLALDAYRFDLKGLSVSYESGPLTIEGGLDKDTSVTPVEYNGSVLIQAATWSIYAIGSYASLDGHPSLFVFARLSATIGGPAFFFVTGLCAGFGYNRALTMPTQDQVPSFPLLAGVSDASKVGGANATPAQALASLSDWVAPAQGVNWFAAGVQFTSFELVQSNVVLAVVVTGDFEIAVLGLSRLKLPQTGGSPFAYVELGIEMVIHPAAGFFGLSAVIAANSFVIDPACHLTGGFAFYIWFAAPTDGSADHSGDFVITLGGYHPSFSKPAWYPTEARLGFSWQISDVIGIQGDAYFALTPSCVMGGGSLDLEFHSGPLHAWFTAEADFLFHWKPFYFLGTLSVSIGVSFKMDLLFCSVTLSVELGASLTLQGPPVAGRVHIDWYIISFSIPFGPDSNAPSSIIDWGDFSKLLPQNDPAKAPASLLVAVADDDIPLNNVCKLILNSGLVTGSAPSDGSWWIRADTFTFSAQTTFPLTEADVSDDGKTQMKVYPLTGDPAPSVAVRPMAIASDQVVSTMLVTMTSDSGPVEKLSNWSFAANLGAVPAALWGAPAPDPSQPDAPSATTIPGNLLGLNQLTPPLSRLTGPPKIPIAHLAYDPLDGLDSQFLPLSAKEQAVTPTVTASATSLQTIADTVAASSVATARGALFAALTGLGYAPGTDGSTTELSTQVNRSYPDAPLLGAPWAQSATEAHS
jgi:hypothetical protein